MRDSFVTEKFVLDLRRVKISYVDQSPRFKDTFFTKYSFPFSFYMDKDLRESMGNYTSLNAVNLLGKHQGYHIVEGKVHRGTLEILEVKGNLIQAQIDSGFEELPNFQKKLSQLPLNEGIPAITNIYEHANAVCRKSYPEVKYNFPRVIYNKHKTDETGWEMFNQFINDRRNNAFVTNNESADAQTHRNRNIIHPMPYLLYVLNVGFADAGYQLAGDILEDADFKQRVIYYMREDFASGVGSKQTFAFLGGQQISTNGSTFYFQTELTMEYVGKYQLYGNIPVGSGKLKVSANNMPIYEVNLQNTHSLHINFDNSIRNGKLKIELWTGELRSTYLSATLQKRVYINDDKETFQIHNMNEVNLQNSVPDITFGELVTTIKNWKNYDLEIVGTKIYMNRLSVQNTTIVDFRAFEVDEPTRVLNHKKSFHLSFTELEEKKLDSIYIDSSGIQINKEAGQDTTSLQINAYCLPVETFKGVTTAAIKKEDDTILGLIYYNGMYDGDNLAQNLQGLHLPSILKVWGDWFKMRTESTEYRWSFICKKNAIRHINIRDTLYAYGQKMWIKEITKNVLNEQMYHVDIVTEVIK